MLLIITLLAVSSMRGVTLEARMTGNMIEQKRLTSAAESALRDGERNIRISTSPLIDCASNNAAPCITEIAAKYDSDFSSSNLYNSAVLDRKARWYVRDTGLISSSDPECFLTGKNCTNYYEVNGQAFQSADSAGKECGPNALCMRSVEARIFN